MKRNRLIASSKRTNLFSEGSGRPLSKYRHLLLLSLLTLGGFFITSIVLATSEPVDSGIESQVIALPGLHSEHQQDTITRQSETKVINLPGNEVQENDLKNTSVNESTKEAASKSLLIDSESTGPVREELTSANKQAPALEWDTITVKSGDNLSLIFPRVGLTARDVYQVAKLDKKIKPLLNLKPGQQLRFAIDDSNGNVSLQKLQLIISPVETFQLSLTEEDGYIVETLKRDVELRQQSVTGSIDSSLFQAGTSAGLSDNLIMELAYIFGWDIDFALDLRKGDHFNLLYNEEFLDGNKIKDGDIIAAEFTNRGKTFRAVRFVDDDGVGRYYTPEGDSMRKAFNRTPVHFSRISSRYNPNRKHPVLKTNRPHRGVDYAARTGTPIMATGDGKVSFVGTKGGYGRTIVLSHGGKYTTLYAHMSRFKKGIKSGKRVSQGDVIGYIGSSGLATGPHLHYEFRVNGVHHNPLTVSLPKAEPLPEKYRTRFFASTQPILAQLDSLQRSSVALNE